MSQKRPASPKAKRVPARRRSGRRYQPPELQEYGSLKELTRTLSNLTPGDGFGASYAI